MSSFIAILYIVKLEIVPSEIMGWSRPIGPLRVWRNIELVNSLGKKIQISIEDIPEDQYPEILNHMCTIFIKDEATLSSMSKFIIKI